MKPFIKFLLIFGFILVLNALLAPVLFKFLPYKFEKIFNRGVEIAVLIWMVWAIRKKTAGFPISSISRPRQEYGLFFVGFSAGFLTLAALMGVKAVLGIVNWNVQPLGFEGWTERLLMALLSALLIGVIEEVFFRGFIFSALREKWKWTFLTSLIVTNLFYAILHFVSQKKPYIDADPNFWDSLKLIAAPFMSLANWQPIVPGVTGLFIFGCILTLLFIRTGSLYPCIGLHAGCVFFLKLDGALTFQKEISPLIYGSSKGYDGMLGWIFLTLMGAALLRLVSKRKTADVL